MPFPEVASDYPHEFCKGTGFFLPDRVALDILVKQFVGIEFGAVGGQIEKIDPLAMFGQPLAGLSGSVNCMVFNDKEHFSWVLTYQAAQEINENPSFESFFEDPEVEVSLIGYGRDHVTSETLSGSFDNRCFTLNPIGATHRMIGTEPHFITPEGHGLFLFGSFPNGRIIVFQPTLNGFGVLFISPAQRLLGCESPSGQVPAYRPDDRRRPKRALIKSNTASLVHKRNGRCCLVRTSSLDCLDDLSGLPRQKRFSFRTPLLLILRPLPPSCRYRLTHLLMD